MNIRNAKYNEHGTIDCEIEHPAYGWIPFTASPDDVEQHGKDIYAELTANGSIAAYVAPSAEEVALQAGEELAMAKQNKKDELVRLKVESMLGTEFAEIDAAKTKGDLSSIAIKYAAPNTGD